MYVPIVHSWSTNVESIGYDGGKMKLLVRFKTGSNYVYSGVDRETVEGIIHAQSVGKYLKAQVIDRCDAIPVDRDGHPV